MTVSAGDQAERKRPPIWVVTVDVAGKLFDVEVPTFQGDQAAGRRAWLALWGKYRALDPEQVRVVKVVPL